MSFHSPARRLCARAFAFILVFAAAGASRAQAPMPRREELLNGLKIMLVPRPGDAKVWMKLRIHSGAAFDLAGKEGLTQLLADALFPDPSTQQYITEELGGQLDVQTTYDAIDVTLSGNAADFDRLAELLRNALFQMRLAPEEVQRLREARLKSLRETPQTAAAVADRAILVRLFGTYPYGRALEGTTESLARVASADLMFARDRFLGPNNATLVVIGGFDPTRAMRTFRQFLGPWRRINGVPPATFIQPDAPDPRALIIAVPGAHDAEVRVAARGLARADKDRAAADLLARVARERWRAALADAQPGGVGASHDAHALTGVFRMYATVPTAAAAQAVESARAVLRGLATIPVSAAELDRAKREVSASHEQAGAQFHFADEWLDSITYNYDASNDSRAFNSVTPADLQRVAARLFRDAPLATTVAGDATALRASLATLAGGVELLGEQPPKPAHTPARPAPAGERKP